MQFLVCILLMFSFSVNAAPFLSSDPIVDTNVTDCAVSVDGAAFVDSPIVASKCNFDVQGGGAITTGSHSIDVKLVANDPVWGRLESAVANFTFSKPAAPAQASGLLLIP